jgi:hypothetical protein
MGLEWAAHGKQETAAELVQAGAVENEARMREDEIERAGEHRWDVVVLWEYWIGEERWQRRLSTVIRRGGGSSVRRRARERKMLWKRSAGRRKRNHRAVIGRALRPRVLLRVQAGAGM